MATHLSVFTDRDNTIEVLGRAAKNNASRSADVKSFGGKCFGKTLIKSETRSVLGDVSNNCTQSTGNNNSELQQSTFAKKNSSASAKRLLGTLNPLANMSLVTAEQFMDEGFHEDIEAMPPNDDDYPDNCEDIWPESERPTREHLQWLSKFYVTFGGDSDAPDQSNSVLSSSFDEDVVSLDDAFPHVAEPRMEMVFALYECEEAEELSFHDDDSFTFL